MNERLLEKLSAVSVRGLYECYPYVLVDARYEKVRENARLHSRAVLVAVGVNMDTRREIRGSISPAGSQRPAGGTFSSP